MPSIAKWISSYRNGSNKRDEKDKDKDGIVRLYGSVEEFAEYEFNIADESGIVYAEPDPTGQRWILYVKAYADLDYQRKENGKATGNKKTTPENLLAGAICDKYLKTSTETERPPLPANVSIYVNVAPATACTIWSPCSNK